MPMNSLAEMPRQPGSSSCSEERARWWCMVLAELFRVDLEERGPRFASLWASALADLPVEALDVACLRAMQTCKFFPSPAEVRALIDHARKVAQIAETDNAWESALDYVRGYFHPDLGVDGRAPKLAPEIERAIRVAGGFRWLWGCPEDQLPWAKKYFVASLANSADLSEVAALLPSGSEARKILRQLTAQPKPSAPKGLAPAPGAFEASEPLPIDDPARADLATLRERLKQPEPKRVMTEAEYEARRELLNRQREAILREQSERQPCAISTN